MAQRFFKISLLLLILIVPLITPILNLGFEQSKVTVFICSLTLISLVSLFKYQKKVQDFNPKLTKIDRGGLIFFITLFITSLFGINPALSIVGQSPYFQGLILYIYLILFSFLIKIFRPNLESVAKVLTLSALIVSLFAIKDWVLITIFQKEVLTYAGRVISTFGSPNLYSGYLLFALPFLYSLIKKASNYKLRLLYLLFGAIISLGIFLSESRVAIFLYCFILFVFLVFKLPKILFHVALFLALLGITLFIFYPFSLKEEFIKHEFVEPLNQEWLIHNSPEKRVFILPGVLELIAQKPILGYGLENLHPTFRNYKQGISVNTLNDPIHHTVKNLYIDRSHNYILDLLFFGGAVLLVSWLYLIFILLKHAKNEILLSGLLIYLIWIQFQVQSVVHLMYFWLLVGLIDIEDKKPSLDKASLKMN